MKRTRIPHAMNYTDRLFAAYATLDLPPQAIVARVQHDKWCPVLRGKTKCKCRPAITLETAQGKIEVLADGSTRHLSTMN
jgi:hypothetical protein